MNLEFNDQAQIDSPTPTVADEPSRTSQQRALHGFQERALDALRASLASGHKRPVLQLPTAGGKTVLAAAIVNSALRRGKRVIFTVPALQLIDQTVESFWQEGIRTVGVMQGDHPLTNRNMPVQVASVQTLARRRIPDADLVLVDEAHVLFDAHCKWMADPKWAKVPFIGLSATPWTKGLGKHYDDLIIAETTQGLIDAGFLSPFRVWAPSHPDLSNVKLVAGDYHEGQLSTEMQRPQLVADVVSTWLQRGENRPTLCFAVDRAHAQCLQERFAAAGVASEYADAYTPRAERTAIGKRLESGQTKVVCNVGIFSVGTNWPFVSCLILARPTRSSILFTQIVGRVLRTHPEKSFALVLDHSDTTMRLGFVTDIQRDALDDGKPKTSAEKRQAEAKEKKNPLPTECMGCGALKTPNVRVCPCCGFTVRKPSTVEMAPGELVEFTRDKKPKQLKLVDKETKQKWYSMLTSIAQQRGYKRGWSAVNYKKKFGVYPKGLMEYPLTPDPEVTNYVRHLMIARAKGQARRAAA